MNRRVLVKGLKIFVIAYCLVGIFIYFVQDYIILRPVTLVAKGVGISTNRAGANNITVSKECI